MNTLRTCLKGIIMLLSFAGGAPLLAEDLPPVAALKPNPDLPDPLTMFDGGTINTRDGWREQRRPELIRLFQHYMYGVPPTAPKSIEATIEREEKSYFGGKA